MKYPVTVETLDESFKKVSGCKMPDTQKPFWDGVAYLVNKAYQEGYDAGKAKAKIPA